jgi:hypothetical protein
MMLDIQASTPTRMKIVAFGLTVPVGGAEVGRCGADCSMAMFARRAACNVLAALTIFEFPHIGWGSESRYQG